MVVLCNSALVNGTLAPLSPWAPVHHLVHDCLCHDCILTSHFATKRPFVSRFEKWGVSFLLPPTCLLLLFSVQSRFQSTCAHLVICPALRKKSNTINTHTRKDASKTHHHSKIQLLLFVLRRRMANTRTEQNRAPVRIYIATASRGCHPFHHHLHHLQSSRIRRRIISHHRITRQRPISCEEQNR